TTGPGGPDRRWPESVLQLWAPWGSVTCQRSAAGSARRVRPRAEKKSDESARAGASGGSARTEIAKTRMPMVARAAVTGHSSVGGTERLAYTVGAPACHGQVRNDEAATSHPVS